MFWFHVQGWLTISKIRLYPSKEPCRSSNIREYVTWLLTRNKFHFFHTFSTCFNFMDFPTNKQANKQIFDGRRSLTRLTWCTIIITIIDFFHIFLWVCCSYNSNFKLWTIITIKWIQWKLDWGMYWYAGCLLFISSMWFLSLSLTLTLFSFFLACLRSIQYWKLHSFFLQVSLQFIALSLWCYLNTEIPINKTKQYTHTTAHE